MWPTCVNKSLILKGKPTNKITCFFTQDDLLSFLSFLSQGLFSTIVPVLKLWHPIHFSGENKHISSNGFYLLLTKCYLFLCRTSVLTSIVSFPHPFASLCTLHSQRGPSGFPFSVRKSERLGLSFGIVAYFHHIPGLFLSPWAGLPVPQPDVIFQLKRGDEAWVVDLHGSEERECPENVSLGNCVWTGQGRLLFCGCYLGVWEGGLGTTFFSHSHLLL